MMHDCIIFHRKLNMQLTSFLSTQPEEGSCARKCLKAAKSLIGVYIQAAVSLKLGWAPENLPNVTLRIPWKQLPAHPPFRGKSCMLPSINLLL